MKIVKAVLTDMDGTLINYDGKYDINTPSLISKLQNRGIQFGVATGKAYFGEVERIIRDLNLSPLNIVNGGGMIVNWQTGETPLHRPISDTSTQYIVNYLQRTGYIFSLETKIGAYMLKVVESPAYTKDITVKPFTPNSIPLGVLKILIHASANKLDENTVMMHIKNIQKECKDIEIIKFALREYYGADITSENSTKHTAVLEYARILNIHPHEIVAIGDGYNDYPLFTACGYRIAMGNAPKELKDIADLIVPPTHEGGMKEALEHIFVIL